MYPLSFLYKEVKIKQRTFSKKRLCEIGEKAMWESRITSFFSYALRGEIGLDSSKNRFFFA